MPAPRLLSCLSAGLCSLRRRRFQRGRQPRTDPPGRSGATASIASGGGLQLHGHLLYAYRFRPTPAREACSGRGRPVNDSHVSERHRQPGHRADGHHGVSCSATRYATCGPAVAGWRRAPRDPPRAAIATQVRSQPVARGDDRSRRAGGRPQRARRIGGSGSSLPL